MASKAGSGAFVCLVKSECREHNTPLKRTVLKLRNETFDDIESMYACTGNSTMTMSVANNETGPWTEVENTDDMFGTPVSAMLDTFGYHFFKVQCCDRREDASPKKLVPSASNFTDQPKVNAFERMMSRPPKVVPPLKIIRCVQVQGLR